MGGRISRVLGLEMDPTDANNLCEMCQKYCKANHAAAPVVPEGATPVENDENSTAPAANAALPSTPAENVTPAANVTPAENITLAENITPAENAAPAENITPVANAAPAANVTPAVNAANEAANAAPAANAANSKNGAATNITPAPVSGGGRRTPRRKRSSRTRQTRKEVRFNE